MCYGLTQMTIESLNEWLKKHKGAYIVTDIKAYNSRGLEYIHKIDPELAKERYIPQLMRFSDYELAKKLGYKRMILTLYQLNKEERKDEAIIDFVKNHKLYAITMPVNRAKKTDLAKTLKHNFNTFVYAHSVDLDLSLIHI